MNDQVMLMTNVTLSGILVVFSVLILLTFIIKIYGSIVSGVINRKNNKTVKTEEIKKVTEKIKQPLLPSISNALVDGDIPAETVAAIVGAVAYVSEGAVSIVSIKKGGE